MGDQSRIDIAREDAGHRPSHTRPARRRFPRATVCAIVRSTPRPRVRPTMRPGRKSDRLITWGVALPPYTTPGGQAARPTGRTGWTPPHTTAARHRPTAAGRGPGHRPSVPHAPRPERARKTAVMNTASEQYSTGLADHARRIGNTGCCLGTSAPRIFGRPPPTGPKKKPGQGEGARPGDGEFSQKNQARHHEGPAPRPAGETISRMQPLLTHEWAGTSPPPPRERGPPAARASAKWRTLRQPEGARQ